MVLETSKIWMYSAKMQQRLTYTKSSTGLLLCDEGMHLIHSHWSPQESDEWH